MIERTHVETVLKANGVPATAPDEIIRSVLISARWDNQDVDTALMVLKENTRTSETHIDSIHKVFYGDNHLSSLDIGKFLGIDVTLREDDIGRPQTAPTNPLRLQVFASVILAMSIVILILAFTMYFNSLVSIIK